MYVYLGTCFKLKIEISCWWWTFSDPLHIFLFYFFFCFVFTLVYFWLVIKIHHCCKAQTEYPAFIHIRFIDWKSSGFFFLVIQMGWVFLTTTILSSQLYHQFHLLKGCSLIHACSCMDHSLNFRFVKRLAVKDCTFCASLISCSVLFFL